MTDLITDDCLAWLDRRDPDRPFVLFCHHKAPHRSWEPDVAHLGLFADDDVPEPATLMDDNATRATVVRAARMGLDQLRPERDLKAPLPPGLAPDEETRWRYQRFIKDYLRASPRSTTTSAGCSIGSRPRASPRTPWWSTPPTRGSSSATTAGSTSA